MTTAPPSQRDAGVAVIGSGPGALAVMWQLISRGIRPVVIDVGERLPRSTAALVEELRSTHGHWRPAAIEEATRNPTMQGNRLPKKLLFGSDFFHGSQRRHSPLLNGSFVDPTFAQGGYTVAWGGAMLPIHDADLMGWPVSREDLAEGFREILHRIPLSGADDGLSDEFPLYGAQPDPLRISAQSASVLRRLSLLRNSGSFASGQARLAVSASGCRYCGLCLSGCPFGVIQTFDTFVRSLARDDLVDYRPGLVVTRIEDVAENTRLHMTDTTGIALAPVDFRTVFLAAGAIGSTRIALESMGLYEQDVTLRDSQKFAVPILVPDRENGSPETMNTLSSVFVDARLAATGSHWNHLQISPFSHYARQAMERKLSLGPFRLHPLAGPFTSRFMVGWGGLHSAHSDGFSLRLLRAQSHGRPVARLEAAPTEATRQKVRRAMRELALRLMPAKALMLTPAAMIGAPGAGFHFGGSLPMRAGTAGQLETDRQGRLATWKRVHVVDSSVFPSIPATTMVLTIMANAWRIAGEAEV